MSAVRSRQRPPFITDKKVITDQRIVRKKGYKDVTIQDLVISNATTLYRLECGFDDRGRFITASLPVETHGEFGIDILSLVKALYYQCRVPMNKIKSTLNAFGVVIGKSAIVDMCHFRDNTQKKELDIARGTTG